MCKKSICEKCYSGEEEKTKSGTRFGSTNSSVGKIEERRAIYVYLLFMNLKIHFEIEQIKSECGLPASL